MSKIEPRTLKGFRDFLPKKARKRQYVIETLRRVFESYGFEPLETPALEYEEILSGKYGDEGDQLMYKFVDKGGRNVALRYDQTVPLARVIAQYQNDLPIPFKRYQIQNVWRADNTQKGRFREFLQCDIDIVGNTSTGSDVEILEIIEKSLRKLGFGSDGTRFRILFNSRDVLFKIAERANIPAGLEPTAFQIFDKRNKVKSLEDLKSEWLSKGLPEDSFYEFDQETLNMSINWKEQNKTGTSLDEIYNKAISNGVNSENIQFMPSIVRGLNYYTGLIIEVEVEGFDAGSVGGGGRYDGLIGMFGNQDIPAVGFAFGFDRLMEAMEEKELFPDSLTTTKALVVIPNQDLETIALSISSRLRSNNINTETYLNSQAEPEKQFKYAEKKEIPYVVVPLNENEVELRTKTIEGNIEKEIISVDQLLEKLKS